MDPQLRSLLAKEGWTVNALSSALSWSQTKVRETLKKHEDEIIASPSTIRVGALCYSLKPDTPVEAPAPVEAPQDACPFCKSENLTPAGGEGSFLGAARICGDCKKTFNAFTGEAILTPIKTRRPSVMPQYKINAKVDAVVAAGGSLVYARTFKAWVLDRPGKARRHLTTLELSEAPIEDLV